MANTKLKLLRILEILSDTDENNPLTATQIGQELQRYGIYAERKSIYSDINVLRDDAGYDIVLSDDNKKGYYMASRDFEDWELKVLIDAVWGNKFLTKSNAEKLEKKLLKLTGVRSRKMLRTVTPVRTTVKSRNVTTKINIDKILKAIKDDRKISFKYFDLDENLNPVLKKEGHNYSVSPYALIWQTDYYYLMCNTDKYDNLGYYRLDKMDSLSMTNEHRKQAKDVVGANPDTKIEECARTALYHFGGEKIRLTLQFKKHMIDDLVDYFGDGIDVKSVDDQYQTTVEVMDSQGLYYWLLQHEKNLKVVSPESVKKKLIEKAKGIIDLYD